MDLESSKEAGTRFFAKGRFFEGRQSLAMVLTTIEVVDDKKEVGEGSGSHQNQFQWDWGSLDYAL